MYSFQAKIGLKKMKNGENKNYHFRFVPTQREIENSKKNSNKIEKIKIYHYGFISSQNMLENVEKEKK